MAQASGPGPSISVSLVEFATDAAVLSRTLRSLAAAVSTAGLDARIRLVDNARRHRLRRLAVSAGIPDSRLSVIEGQGNVGYGRGHNLALAGCESRYHLILNPDVEMAEDSLAQAVVFMEAHPECGLLVPSALDGQGEQQFLCKRYPTVFDLFLRGFAPRGLQMRFRTRLCRYEMREMFDGRNTLWAPPLTSGCFMFFRTSVLNQLGGFDLRYFLYLEDFDLSLRAGRITKVACQPSVRIVHHGGNAARKGWRHVWLFSRSTLLFFRTHGWRWW